VTEADLSGTRHPDAELVDFGRGDNGRNEAAPIAFGTFAVRHSAIMLA